MMTLMTTMMMIMEMMMMMMINTDTCVAEMQEPVRPRIARYSEVELISTRWREITCGAMQWSN